VAIKFFIDESCTKEIAQISWKGSVTITLITGEKVTFDNAYKIGEVAKAIFYVMNDSNNNFAVTELIIDDKRIHISIENPWLYPSKPVKVELTFPIKDEIVLQGNKIEIKGYYVIQG